MNESLTELLKRAAKHKLTPYEIWQQRVSFVYGNLWNDRITREMVEQEAIKTYGPCPAPTGEEWKP